MRAYKNDETAEGGIDDMGGIDIELGGDGEQESAADDDDDERDESRPSGEEPSAYIYTCLRRASASCLSPADCRSRCGTVRSGWRDTPEPLTWLWLRDACQCPRCVHPTTRQKLHRSSDFPLDIRPIRPVALDQSSATISWSHNHVSTYSDSYIRRLAAPVSPISRIPWSAPSLPLSAALWTPYHAIYSDKHARFRLVNQLLNTE